MKSVLREEYVSLFTIPVRWNWAHTFTWVFKSGQLRSFRIAGMYNQEQCLLLKRKYSFMSYVLFLLQPALFFRKYSCINLCSTFWSCLLCFGWLKCFSRCFHFLSGSWSNWSCPCMLCRLWSANKLRLYSGVQVYRMSQFGRCRCFIFWSFLFMEVFQLVLCLQQ